MKEYKGINDSIPVIKPSDERINEIFQKKSVQIRNIRSGQEDQLKALDEEMSDLILYMDLREKFTSENSDAFFDKHGSKMTKLTKLIELYGWVKEGENPETEIMDLKLLWNQYSFLKKSIEKNSIPANA